MTRFNSTTSFPLRRLLALATLAVAGGVAVTSATTAWAGPEGRAMGSMHGGGFGGPGMGRMLEQVGASAEQRGQIEQIMKSAREELRARHDEGRALREQMRALFAQPEIDESAVESLRQQMLAQHDATSRRLTQAMLEASRVLSPEQRAQLAEAMGQRAEQRGERRQHLHRKADGGRGNG